MVALWLEVGGAAHLLHHHTIYHSGQILLGGVALLGAWQVMTAAMMLPGALPAVLRVSSLHARFTFLAVYAAAWTGFAVVAFAGDMGLHALVHAWAPIARHESLIPAAVLIAAALYQVSPWKAASLDACRRMAGGDVASSFRYSRQCVLSGWALMLVMFSAGVANLIWMAVLALTMLAEKTLPSGDRVRYLVAGALSVLAVLALLGAQVL